MKAAWNNCKRLNARWLMVVAMVMAFVPPTILLSGYIWNIQWMIVGGGIACAIVTIDTLRVFGITVNRAYAERNQFLESMGIMDEEIEA